MSTNISNPNILLAKGTVTNDFLQQSNNNLLNIQTSQAVSRTAASQPWLKPNSQTEIVYHPEKGLLIHKDAHAPKHMKKATVEKKRIFMSVSKDKRLQPEFYKQMLKDNFVKSQNPYHNSTLTDYISLDDTRPDEELPLEYTAADYKRAKGFY